MQFQSLLLAPRDTFLSLLSLQTKVLQLFLWVNVVHVWPTSLAGHGLCLTGSLSFLQATDLTVCYRVGTAGDLHSLTSLGPPPLLAH